MDIDKLSIEIESDATDASSNIDKLASSLKNLETNLKGVGSLRSFSTSLKNFNSISKDFNLAQFDKIANGINRLSNSFVGLNGFETGATGLLKELGYIKSIANDVDNVKFDKFETQIKNLANSLKSLEALGKTNLGSVFNSLRKIPEVSKNLETVDFKRFTYNIRMLADAIKPLDGVSVRLGRAFSNLPWHIKKATAQLDKYDKSVRNSTKSSSSLMSRLGKSVSSFQTIAFIITGLGMAIGNVFEESSSYIENLNLFNVALGECTESAMEFAQKVQNAIGIDMGQWMKYQGSFNMLITGFGVASDKAQLMSQNLTQLAYDYSSLTNVDVSSAFDKLNSAMSGQIKGLKEFGNNVSIAMVKQTGLKYGLSGAVSSWDQNTQAIMRYITIMENASKVDVFNDMARTIATPANAVRILTQQFDMLKRAIGNIASVFISKLVPYVQIAVKWLTALANSIANFFGFELPKIDYSGLAGGGIGDLEEDAEDAGNAVGGVSDKVKELKKQLMGFDELNIINAPDNKSGGGSGGAGIPNGGSIGDIELPEYDFLKGIENQTNEMMDRLSKKFTKLFKPVTDSWNKYGKGVLDSIEYKWDEIGDLVNSVGISFNTVWQNGTGEESINRILSTITNMEIACGNIAKKMREAWNEAGNGTAIVQNLWDSFNNLAKLADDISRSFSSFGEDLNFKPLIKSVKDFTESMEDLSKSVSGILYDAYVDVLESLAKWSIEKAIPKIIDSLTKAFKGLSKILNALRPAINIVEKITTALIKLGGNAILKGINLLAKGIDKLGDLFNRFPRLMSGVTASVVTFMSAWKIDKLLSANSKIKTLVASLKLIPNAVSAIKTVGFTQAMSDWASASLGTSNKITSFIGVCSKLNSITGPLSAVSTGFGMLATKASAATGASSLLTTSLTFLAGNPLVGLAVGIGALTAGFVALVSLTNKTNNEYEKQIENSKKLAEECDKLASAQQELNNSARDSVINVNSQYESTSLYVAKLKEMIDENGKISGSLATAQTYVDLINESLGTNITITDGAIENWKDEKKSIDDVIESMKQKAKVQAYEEAYIEALKKEKEVRAKLTTAQNDYSKAQKDYMNQLAKYGATWDDYINKTDKYYEAQNKLNSSGDKTSVAFNEASKALSKAEKAMAKNTEAQNNFNASSKALDKTVKSLAESIKEEYGEITKDGHYTYETLKNGIADLNSALDKNGERYKAMSEKEREASRLARDQLISDMIAKSVQHNKSYSEMKETLGSAWDTMSKTEKANLKKQYDELKKSKDAEKKLYDDQKNALLGVLDQYNIDRTSKQAVQWQNELVEAQKNGSAQGQKYIDSLVSDLMTGKTKTDSSGDEIGKGFKNNLEKNVAYFRANDVDAKKKLDTLEKMKLHDKKAYLEFESKTKGFKLVNGIAGGKGIMEILKFASGGFPDMGQMFIAREAGPELVGRIGSKTAVANNNQIISGISSGVYSAVKNAMSGTNNGGKFTINVVAEIDKKAVGKATVDYNNGIVKQTGKSPLLI